MTLKLPLQFEARRVPSAEALQSFIAACLGAGKTLGTEAQLQLTTNLRSHGIAFQDQQAHKKAVDRLTKDPFEMIDNISCLWPGLSKPQQSKQFHVKLTPDHQRFLFRVELDSPPDHAEKAEVLLTAFREHFEPRDFRLQRFDGLPEELKRFHIAQEEIYAQREAQLLKGNERLQSAILTAEESAQKRIEAEREKVDAERSALEIDFQQKRKAVEDHEAALTQREKELDDRARMHARRALEKSVAAVIEKHGVFKLSTSAKAKRLAIHFTCIAAILIAVWLYHHALSLMPEDGIRSREISMLITATLLGGSTLIFYIRWLNEWFRSHAQVELFTKSLDEDFTRASWLVELLFEWHKEHAEEEFPPDVLSSLTRGLFTMTREIGTRAEHPIAEALSRLPGPKTISVDNKRGRVKVDLESRGPQSQQ